MQATKVQFRGHCQCCGRQQAVQKGRMSKHGYEVKDRGNYGWFQGVCSGHLHAPVEQDRKVLDEMVVVIRAEVVRLNKLADKYESGEITPDTCQTNRLDPQTRKNLVVAWADARPWEQEAEVRSRVWGARQRASAGKSQADMMQRIADTYHGKPLTEVTKADGPAPIEDGAQKVDARGRTLTVRYVERGRVNYSYVNDAGKTFSSRTTTRAWRNLKDVA